MTRTTTVNIHATCVRVARAGTQFRAPADAGILLLGESGSGKSDLALRLIAMGAELVADDRVDLCVLRGRLSARPPRALAGLLEVRGLGIVEIPYTEQVRVTVAAALVRGRVARLPDAERYRPPDGLTLRKSMWPPLVRIAVLEASAPAKILAAAAAFSRDLLRDAVKPR